MTMKSFLPYQKIENTFSEKKKKNQITKLYFVLELCSCGCNPNYMTAGVTVIFDVVLK